MRSCLVCNAFLRRAEKIFRPVASRDVALWHFAMICFNLSSILMALDTRSPSSSCDSFDIMTSFAEPDVAARSFVALIASASACCIQSSFLLLRYLQLRVLQYRAEGGKREERRRGRRRSITYDNKDERESREVREEIDARLQGTSKEYSCNSKVKSRAQRVRVRNAFSPSYERRYLKNNLELGDKCHEQKAHGIVRNVPGMLHSPRACHASRQNVKIVFFTPSLQRSITLVRHLSQSFQRAIDAAPPSSPQSNFNA